MKRLSMGFKVRCSIVLVLAMIVSILSPSICALAEPNQPDKNAWLPYEHYLNSNTPKKEDMRATWITTVYNSDWPSSDSLTITDTEKRVKKQKEELCNILDAAVLSNLNAVMFQVRTASDAIYKSDIVPWSVVLTGTPGGDPGFDPLKFATEEAHKRGLELHAWFNPYRAATAVNDNMVEQLKKLPKSIFNTHLDWIKKCSDGVYAVDPGIPAVRSWVKNCVMEVVDKYDIDGVHFDDYFYHEGTAYDYNDKDTFKKYNDGFANIGDWRRNNTYKLISELSQKIRSEKPWVKFGVSPAGMWGNIKDGHTNGSPTAGGAPNYDRAFADTLRWANEGLIDYLCPQDYWPFGRDVAPYGVIATWWADHITNPNTKLYIGMGLYRVNDSTNSTETGFLDPYAKDEMIREIQLNTNYKSTVTGHCIDGSFLYQSSNIVPNKGIYKKDAVENGIRNAWKYKAIAPKSSWKSNVPPPMPTEVTVSTVTDGTQITWKSSDETNITAYYAVYRFEKDKPQNIDDPTKIIAVIGKNITTYIDKSTNDPSSVQYAVTALDRLHNESLPSASTTGSSITIGNTTPASIVTNYSGVKIDNTTVSSNITTHNQINMPANIVTTDNPIKKVIYKTPDIGIPRNAIDVDITTATGTSPILPVSVKINMTTGDTANMMVKWNKVTYENMYSNVGNKFDVTGTVINVNGSPTSMNVTAHVSVVEPTIKYICPVVVKTEQNVAPVFPDKVDVIYTDNRVGQCSVTWEAPKSEDYKDAAPLNEFKNPSVKGILGTAHGTSLKAKGSYIVYPAVASYEAVNIKTRVGIPPILPSEVKANYSDGTSTSVNVTWDQITKENYSKIGNFNVNGIVEGVKMKVTATVKVEKLINIVNIEKVYVKTGIGVAPKLPSTVKVNYDDGTVESVPVTWPYVNPPEQCGSPHRFTVIGTINGTTTNVTATVEVAAIIVLDNFENGGDAQSMIKWTGDSVSNTPPALSYDTNIRHSGNSSLKIDYKLSKVVGTGSAYVRPNAGTGIVFNKGEVPQKIGFWLYGNNVKTYALRAEFRSGTAPNSPNKNQNISNTLDFTGWRYMEYPVDPSYQNTGLCITLMPGIVATSSDKVDSAIYIDDLVAVFGSEIKDLTEINNAISLAQNLYDSTKAGIGNGQYPMSERDGLKASIDAAVSLRDNTKATVEDIYSATNLLNSAIDTYKASKIISERYEVIEDYEDHGSGKSMVEWINDGGSTKPAISYNSNKQYVKNGSRSFKIDYNFQGTSGTASAYVKGAYYPNSKLKFTGENTPNKIGFWLYGNDKPIYSLRAEIRKADGTSATTANFLPSNSIMKAGWNFMTYDIPKDKFNATTGILLNIIPGLVETSDSKKINSTIYIDDLTTICSVTTNAAINKTELLGAIGTSKSLLLGAEEGTQGGQYPKGSKENLNNALTGAQGFVNSTVQKDIDSAVKSLKEAIDVFKNSQIPLIDKPGLKAIIDAAQKKEISAVEGTKPGQYKAGAKAALKAAIDGATKVYNNEAATKVEVEEAKTALVKAVTEFDKKVVPQLLMSALDDTINRAKSLCDGAVAGNNPGQYPEKSIEDFKVAIDTAITAKAKAETQMDIDNALSNLNSAIKAFESTMVPLKVDKATLLEAIKNTKTKVDKALVGKLGGQYPQAARDEITAAIAVAQGVFDNIHSEQKDINAAIETLKVDLDKYLKSRIPAPWDKYNIPEETTVNKREMRAAWISTVVNIDWPSTDSWKIEDSKTRADAQKSDLIKILDHLQLTGCNAVMFQVRPTSDTFYKSKLAPWSYWLTGKQDVDPEFDPLQFAIDEAHNRNLELHAWVNPYRVSMPAALYKDESGKALTSLDQVAAMLSNVPNSIYAKHPEWVKIASKRFVLDPGIPEAENYVEDCVMEIVENYDVDGIHFDDYFYVGNNGGFDAGYSDQGTYDAYGDKTKFPDIKDWRRNNTYTLINNLHEKINGVKPWIKFGVSPAGVWGNKKDGHPDGSDTGAGIPNYDHAYADTKKWVLDGLIDYICPQVYWTFNNSSAAYGVVSSWWADLLKNNPNVQTQLYIGLGLYWLNPDDEESSDPYWNTLGVGDQEIARQLRFNAANPDIDGTMIFTYNSFRANYPNAISAASLIKNDLWRNKALVPRMPWKSGVTPKAPVIIDALNKDGSTTIRWNDSDVNTAYYAVYRFEGNEQVNIDNANRLIAKVRKNSTGIQSYTDAKGKLGNKYVVTSLNRLSDESTPSNEVINSGNSNGGNNNENNDEDHTNNDSKIISNSNNSKNETSKPAVSHEKERLAGDNKFYTAAAIAESFAPGKVKKIVIATGNNFSDALSGSVFAKSIDAPILLAGSTSKENEAALEYIKNHLEKDGEVCILGGQGSLSDDVVKSINNLGFNKIKRLSGDNRYDTCKMINEELNVKKGTPVVIVTGNDFADGLSIASIAAINGYPILLTDNNSLPSQIEEMLKNIEPSKVFIVGGTGAVSDDVEKHIKSVTGISKDNMIRLQGDGRYETSIAVAKYFKLDSDTVCFASGENFADALTGSVLAAKYNASIILIGNDASMQKQYLDSIKYKKQIIFGGEGAINTSIENLLIK